MKTTLRVIIEVTVDNPTEHEKRDLQAIIDVEGPEFAAEVVGTVFGDQYEFVKASIDIL